MLNALESLLPQRYWAWAACIALTIAGLSLTPFLHQLLPLALTFGVLSVVGLVDYLQQRQAIRRN